ncbi:MAG: MerR family transcriptional regulator [Novosphingobium sp.]
MSEPGSALTTDGKAADAFRTIGEVAKLLGIRQHVLRYWEDQFPMLRPVKRSGGRRYYRPEDVRLVQTIDRLVHGQGYTLRGARQAIEAEAKGAKSAVSVSQPATSAPPAATSAVPGRDITAALRAIRSQLAAALAE